MTLLTSKFPVTFTVKFTVISKYLVNAIPENLQELYLQWYSQEFTGILHLSLQGLSKLFSNPVPWCAGCSVCVAWVGIVSHMGFSPQVYASIALTYFNE